MTRAANAGAALALTALVLAADQATKALVRARIPYGDSRDIGPFELVHTENTGIAFGLFSDGGTLLVVGIIAAVVGLGVFFATQSRRPGIWLPVGLLLGGALGNLLDRALQGGVTDFLKVPYWPTFNVADIGITGGVLVLLVQMYRQDRE